jgi:hypothetical protein
MFLNCLALISRNTLLVLSIFFVPFITAVTMILAFVTGLRAQSSGQLSNAESRAVASYHGGCTILSLANI